jgi:lipid-binding SYLF domain-containing protein
MKHKMMATTLIGAALGLGAGAANAGKYQDATDSFKKAQQSSAFFQRSYAYAVFPTIGQGGFGIGAAHGRGRVYVHGAQVGETAVTQLSIGWQAGGEAYSEIIFFENQSALQEFQSGSFEFGAGASVTAITAGASADVGSQGAGAGASVDSKNAAVTGFYNHGMAVFTIVKAGLMFDASLQGEKFSYKARVRS